MNYMQNQVKRFMLKQEQEIPQTLTWPDIKTLQLRCDLVTEEVNELIEACTDQDMVGVIDALCDILYVVFGFAITLGIDIETFFNEVHLSNMSKDGGKDYFGKVMKGNAYFPPGIKRVLDDITRDGGKIT